MGSGGSKTPSTLPPPPQPVIKYDPATSAAEAALAGAKKDSYASSVETDEQKQKRQNLGLNQTQQTPQQPRRQKSAATMMAPTGAGMNAAALVTG